MSDTDIADAGHDGMVWLPGGTFTMGSNRFYPEETPPRRARVDGFWVDAAPVTNAQFAAFVRATGHVTVAEMAPDPGDYPGLEPDRAVAGSLVFRMTAGPVPLDEYHRWWDFTHGASWRHPYGPDSDLNGLDDHPVVHVAFADAVAYAAWAGKALPTEAEWEYAARGGTDSDYAWGDELAPGGRMLANYWQGLFPFANQCLDGWERTSPVRTFPANGFGLYDMIGNVWEWTADRYTLPKSLRSDRSNPPRRCCGGKHDAARPAIADYVIKGGSHLCAENYCQRYRPAARHPQSADTSTSHVGFRCIVRKR